MPIINTHHDSRLQLQSHLVIPCLLPSFQHDINRHGQGFRRWSHDDSTSNLRSFSKVLQLDDQTPIDKRHGRRDIVQEGDEGRWDDLSAESEEERLHRAIIEEVDFLLSECRCDRATNRVLETPVVWIQLNAQRWFPFPRLLEHCACETVVVVARCACHDGLERE